MQALSAGIDSKAQGLGSILELLEGGIGGEGVAYVLCALRSHLLEL